MAAAKWQISKWQLAGQLCPGPTLRTAVLSTKVSLGATAGRRHIKLSDAEIAALALYVSKVSGGAK